MRTKLELVPKSEQSFDLPPSPSVQQHEFGFFGKIQHTRALGKAAARVATELGTAKLDAEERIGKTGIAMAEAKIRGAIVAAGIGDLGAMAEAIDRQTGAVQDRLTVCAETQWQCDIETRSQAHTAIDESLARGLLTPEEADALKARATANFVRNVDLAQRRLETSTEGTETIRNLAQSGVRRAAESIK